MSSGALERGGLTGWRWQVGDKVFAHGKDMYYDGWEDTVQINYGHPKAREEMTKVACRVCVRRCDIGAGARLKSEASREEAASCLGVLACLCSLDLLGVRI